MADWANGYGSEFELCKVNTGTWAASERVSGVTSLSIKKSGTESVPLIENATLECDEQVDDGWYTVFVVVDGTEKVALGTYLFEATSEHFKWSYGTYKYSGFSVLKPADESMVTVGSFVAKGTNGAEEAAKLLRSCIPAPVSVIGGFSLSDNVVLSIGMSKLAAAWALLDSGGYCIMIDGLGNVTIQKAPSEPSLRLTSDNMNLLMPEIDIDRKTQGVPNRYYAVSGSMVATAVNQDPDSPTSYQSRGRWIDTCDKSPKRVNGETLQEYAQRRLEEVSTVTASIKYKREFVPDVVPFSIVRIDLPSHGIAGDYVVESQSITCGNGVYVDETAGRRVALWR